MPGNVTTLTITQYNAMHGQEIYKGGNDSTFVQRVALDSDVLLRYHEQTVLKHMTHDASRKQHKKPKI